MQMSAREFSNVLDFSDKLTYLWLHLLCIHTRLFEEQNNHQIKRKHKIAIDTELAILQNTQRESEIYLREIRHCKIRKN